MASVSNPEIIIEWEENVTLDSTFADAQTSKVIHDPTLSVSTHLTVAATAGQNFITVDDDTSIRGGARVKIDDDVNSEYLWVSYTQPSLNKMFFDSNLQNSYLSGASSVVTVDALNLVSLNLKLTNHESIGEADIALEHFVMDSSVKGTWLGQRSDAAADQNWRHRQIQIRINNGVDYKVFRCRIVSYEDSQSIGFPIMRTLRCTCVGGEVLTRRLIVPTDWSNSTMSTVLGAILSSDDTYLDMPNYQMHTNGLVWYNDDSSEFNVPANFDLTGEKITKFDLIKKLSEYVGFEYDGTTAHNKQYQFTVSYADPASHNHGLVEFAHAGDPADHTLHNDGGTSDAMILPTVTTDIKSTTTVSSTNNVISIDNREYDAERIINIIHKQGTKLSDGWTDYYYGRLSTYVGKSAGTTLSEDSDTAGTGGNVSIKAANGATYPSIIFDLENTDAPDATSPFFGYRTLNLAVFPDFSIWHRNNENGKTLSIILTDENDDQVIHNATTDIAWHNHNESFETGLWTLYGGSLDFDFTVVKKIEFQKTVDGVTAGVSGDLYIDNFEISGLPMLASAEDSNSQAQWGVKENKEIEEVKVDNQLMLVQRADSDLKRTLEPVDRLVVRIPIAPDIKPIHKIDVRLPNINIGTDSTAKEYRVMSVNHICDNNGYETILELEPLEGSNYPSDSISSLMISNPILGLATYLNNKIIAQTSTPSTLIFGAGGGSAVGDYVAKTGDIMTGNLNLNRGADLYVWSGNLSGLVFSVDGATGTVTTASSTKVTNLQADSVDGTHFDGFTKVQGGDDLVDKGDGGVDVSFPSAFSGVPNIIVDVNGYAINTGHQISNRTVNGFTVTVYKHATASVVTATGTIDADGAHTHTVNGSVGAGSAHTHTTSGTSAAGAAHKHALGGANTSSEAPDTPHNHSLLGDTANESSHTHGIGTIAAANESAHTHTDTFTTASDGSHTHTFTGDTSSSMVSGWEKVPDGTKIVYIAFE